MTTIYEYNLIVPIIKMYVFAWLGINQETATGYSGNTCWVNLRTRSKKEDRLGEGGDIKGKVLWNRRENRGSDTAKLQE